MCVSWLVELIQIHVLNQEAITCAFLLLLDLHTQQAVLASLGGSDFFFFNLDMLLGTSIGLVYLQQFIRSL